MNRFIDESRDAWKRAVDRQYSFFGATLGLIIAALAIIVSPIAEDRVHPTRLDQVLLTMATWGASSSIIILLAMVHIERKIAWFGGDKKYQNAENRLRLSVNLMLALTVISIVILMVLKIWSV